MHQLSRISYAGVKLLLWPALASMRAVQTAVELLQPHALAQATAEAETLTAGVAWFAFVAAALEAEALEAKVAQSLALAAAKAAVMGQ